MYKRLYWGLCFASHAKRASVLLVALMIVGCSSGKVSLSERIRLINLQAGELSDVWHESVSLEQGMQLYVVKNYREIQASEPLRIYIEGDGHAYLSKGVVSGDPTPINPLGLQLAFADTHAAVMYIGRPCQWGRGPECKDRSLWTTQRFTERMAQAYVSLIQEESHGRPVELIGYSGGAWIALQVAARLDNVVNVTTVAGNLMPDYVNVHHKVTRIEVAPYPGHRLSVLPITAYVGVRDTIVPRGIVQDFQQKTGASDVRVIEIDASHGEGWEPVFNRL